MAQGVVTEDIAQEESNLIFDWKNLMNKEEIF